MQYKTGAKVMTLAIVLIACSCIKKPSQGYIYNILYTQVIKNWNWEKLAALL